MNHIRRVAVKSAGVALRNSSYTSRGAAQPLVQNYRNSWPETEYFAPTQSEDDFALPPRTVKDDVLRFKLTARFDFGASLYYPHLDTHPGDFKVSLMVFTNDLNLTPEELKILLRMVGPRYNHNKKEIKITCKRFPNRIENKRFAVLTLEKLLVEARRIAAGDLEYEE
jgi:hypothetical protein